MVDLSIVMLVYHKLYKACKGIFSFWFTLGTWFGPVRLLQWSPWQSEAICWCLSWRSKHSHPNWGSIESPRVLLYWCRCLDSEPYLRILWNSSDTPKSKVKHPRIFRNPFRTLATVPSFSVRFPVCARPPGGYTSLLLAIGKLGAAGLATAGGMSCPSSHLRDENKAVLWILSSHVCYAPVFDLVHRHPQNTPPKLKMEPESAVIITLW